MSNNIAQTKYRSDYPSEVTYKSDKNFIVRLKAMIDRELSSMGHKLPSAFFELFDNAEEYLFESTSLSTPHPEAATEGERTAEDWKKVYNDLFTNAKGRYGSINQINDFIQEVVRYISDRNKYNWTRVEDGFENNEWCLVTGDNWPHPEVCSHYEGEPITKWHFSDGRLCCNITHYKSLKAASSSSQQGENQEETWKEFMRLWMLRTPFSVLQSKFKITLNKAL